MESKSDNIYLHPHNMSLDEKGKRLIDNTGDKRLGVNLCKELAWQYSNAAGIISARPINKELDLLFYLWFDIVYLFVKSMKYKIKFGFYKSLRLISDPPCEINAFFTK